MDKAGTNKYWDIMELGFFIKSNLVKSSCFLLSALSAESKKKNKKPLCPRSVAIAALARRRLCLHARSSLGEDWCGKRLRFYSTIFSLISLLILFAPNLKADDSADELYRQGRFGEAEKAYAQGDMDHPKNIRYRYNRGCAAYQNGDYKGAGAAFSSIYRRSEDESLRYKAAYNLGNTAFKQGDFESAIQYYKTALVYDSENKDARYNLELALRERENQKKEQQKQEDQKQQESSEDQKQKQKDKQKEKGEQKSEESQQQQEDKSETAKNQGKEGNNQQQAGQNKTEKNPQDLSGKLSPRQAMEEGKKEEQPSEETKAGIDKKKAEALLDNIQEDPSRILRFQIPSDKRGGVGSGKNW